MIMYNYASQNKYIRCPLCQNKYSVFNIRNHYVECYKKWVSQLWIRDKIQ